MTRKQWLASAMVAREKSPDCLVKSPFAWTTDLRGRTSRLEAF
jgi:hypothetical protein